MVQRSSYIDRILVRRVNLGLLSCPRFHRVVYLDHKLAHVRMNLDKSKPRLGGY